ncbi:NTE family protein [Nocardioides thalensis]|uniref:NTE family protein n=1 Tax=Nocardioides thalensis TaxID=1914755 RepID=A0A853C317_9ACTN|nr:patatin-like phospholipase family protein [Nocardioides thalensis]NYJ01754.1 NTE family protein [Nocardioides thalensis]
MTTRRALAIGCGGTLGLAWTAVALSELERALDWDVRDAHTLVGTSAGAELVAAIGSGRSTADLLAALDHEPGADSLLTGHLDTHPGHLPRFPAIGVPAWGLVRAGIRGGSAYTAVAGLLPRGSADASWLRAFGEVLADPATGWTIHPDTLIVAADARTGRRVAFGDADAPSADLGDAVAASWAIPGWFPPVGIGGRSYVDGGAVSSVSADLLLGREVDEVVVVAPMTTHGGVPGTGLSRLERLLRSQMTRGLDREVAMLRDAGIRVIRVEPGADELAAMGPNFMDIARREAAIVAARRALPARVAAAVRAADTAGATA